MRRWLPHLLVGALLLAPLVSLRPGTAQAGSTTISDNFSTDTGLWTYTGTAYRDTTNQYVQLTPAEQSKYGQIWLKQKIFAPFTASFRYKAGGDYNGGADGIVFMFNKKADYSPTEGGNLGFWQNGCAACAPGYGIEFDNWYNGEFGDPSGNYVAILKDTVANHLTDKNDSRTEDNQWHDVKVAVGYDTVTVWIDGGLELAWKGTIDRKYGGMGFTAATGWATNYQYVDDFKVSVDPIVWLSPLSSRDTASVAAGDTIPIRFWYGDPGGFIHDETVTVIVRDTANPTIPIAAWVYGSDVAVDDAAQLYKQDCSAAAYSVAPGTTLAIQVYMQGYLMGQSLVTVHA